jgi:CBS domain containing-hemolysin-like protein
MLFEILLIVFLVALNGLFVAAEFAIVKVRASQVELRAQEGSNAAKLAEHILDHINTYLSATQLGITIASLALGWFGEETVTKIIYPLIKEFNFQITETTVHQISLGISFMFVTFLHIVFGEIAPKALGIKLPEQIILFVSPFLRLFYLVFKPFIYVLNASANVLLRLIGINPNEMVEGHSAEELKLLIKQGAEEGTIPSSQQEMIENVFNFSGLTAKQILVPRTKVIALEVSSPDEEVLQRIIGEGYSRMPVYKDTLDDIVGIVHTKDIIPMIHHNQPIVLRDILRPAYLIPETKTVSELLKDFQKKRMHMAVVIDEFGGTSGIVTMEDVIEELVGEIQDEYDDEATKVEKVDENTYLVRGQVRIQEVNEFLRYPLSEGDDYDTIAGMMNYIFGKIPEDMEVKESGGYRFTIMKSNPKAVEYVKIAELLKDTD